MNSSIGERLGDRLSGIEAFVMAVEAGNFAQAAQRLQITRSAVAKSVSRLEARLGTRLFQRTTRTQQLTEDGQAYYEHCRRALAELDAADAALEAGRKTPSGRLRVTMPSLVGRELIAPVLLELAQEYPELTLEIIFSDSVIDLVDERFDLAVRSGSLADSTVLAMRPLGRQWMGVFASPAYLARHEPIGSVEVLLARPEQHCFVGYTRDTGLIPWPFFDQAGQLRHFEITSKVSFSCNSLETSRMAAIAGMGLARLPTWLVADAVKSGALVRVFDEPNPYGYALHAVWPQARALPLKTRVAIDKLVECLPSLLSAKNCHTTPQA